MIEAPVNHETSEAKRAELAILLSSDLFRRAPTLARIVQYLCEREMQGASFVKEYEIATTVMGRPSDFDPLLDGSVRVNLHHLRKKLRQYYETEGADHTIEIALPMGRSLPSFIVKEQPRTEPEPVVDVEPKESAPVAAELLSADLQTPDESQPPDEPVRVPAWRLWPLTLALLMVVIGLAIGYFTRHTVSAPGGTAASDAVVRIASGRTAPFHDSMGRVWLADTFVRGGKTFSRNVPLVSDGGPAEIYTHGREGAFGYAIPLPVGTYEVHLYFAETSVHGEGFRTMAISFNGKRVNQTLDVTSDAGGFATPTEKIFSGLQPSGDGKLHIDLQGVIGSAFLNGLEIVEGVGAKMRTLRQSTLNQYYVDPDGILWQPDAWFRGGRISHLRELFPQMPIPGLFSNERFGNFTYSIPVIAAHTYSATIYFQDLWFSQNKKDLGRRRFDVSCNGRILLHDFNILSDAVPGTNRATMHFSGLTPTGQGKLIFNFSPTENYASVAAIKIEDETPDSNASDGSTAKPAPAQN